MPTKEQLKQEIDDIKDRNGGPVCKKDFELHEEKNEKHFSEIKGTISDIKSNQNHLQERMDMIYPKISKDIEVADAWKVLGKEFQKKTSRSGFWVKAVFTTIVITYIVITSLIMLAGWIKGLRF